MKKKWVGYKGRVSIVKYGETPFRGWACEIPMGLPVCDGPMETVEYMWVVRHDLQCQRLLQSPRIYSLFLHDL